MLLSTAYFPPIEYFALMAKDFTLSKDGVIPSIVSIEANENYQKQSYRNRCYFYADSGKQALNIPIIHSDSKSIRDIRIDYSTNWLQLHKRAIMSAYNTSAYFEYYVDDLFEVMDRKIEYLFDFNLELIKFFIEKLTLAVDLRLTKDYQPPIESIKDDYRYIIHPKKDNTVLKELRLDKEYFQVFATRHGFISNLSIMDLLFNEGPDAITFLKKM